MFDGCFDFIGFIALLSVVAAVAVAAAIRHALAGPPSLSVVATLYADPTPHLRLLLAVAKPRDLEIERISVSRSMAEGLGLRAPEGFMLGVDSSAEPLAAVSFEGRFSVLKGQNLTIIFPAERVAPAEGQITVDYAYRTGFSSVTASAVAQLNAQSVA